MPLSFYPLRANRIFIVLALYSQNGRRFYDGETVQHRAAEMFFR